MESKVQTLSEPVVVRYKNVTDLITSSNPERLVGKRYLREAEQVWKKIREIFSVYATSHTLPLPADSWHVIGRYGSEAVVLSSSLNLVPYNPPKYIALVHSGETYVIDSRVSNYRKVYVRILRLLSKATLVDF